MINIVKSRTSYGQRYNPPCTRTTDAIVRLGAATTNALSFSKSSGHSKFSPLITSFPGYTNSIPTFRNNLGKFNQSIKSIGIIYWPNMRLPTNCLRIMQQTLIVIVLLTQYFLPSIGSVPSVSEQWNPFPGVNVGAEIIQTYKTLVAVTLLTETTPGVEITTKRQETATIDPAGECLRAFQKPPSKIGCGKSLSILVIAVPTFEYTALLLSGQSLEQGILPIRPTAREQGPASQKASSRHRLLHCPA